MADPKNGRLRRMLKRFSELCSFIVGSDHRRGEEAILEINRDITERKRAEHALQIERQRFRDVLDCLPVYVVLLTPDYHVALDNCVFRERLGESQGRPCYEFLFHRDSPCEICETYRVLKTGKPHQWKWTGPDGRHYDIFDFPFADTDGSPLILEMGIDITEREEAERARRAVEANLAALVESTGDLVWSVDLNYGLITFNRALQQHIQRSYGIQVEAGMQPEKLLPPDKARLWPPMYARALSEGAYQVEYPIPDGRTLELSFNAIVQDGCKTGVSVFAKDITQRKRAEAELSRLNQELEERVRRRTAELQTIFDTAPIGLAITDDPKGRHIRGNPAMERMLNVAAGGELSKSAPEGGPPLRILKDGRDQHPEDAPIQRAARGETVSGEVLEIVWPDRPALTVYASASPVFDENQQPRGAVGAFQDITERKRAEAELERTRNLLAEGQRIAHLGTFEYVADAQTTEWSEEEYRIYGLDPAGPSPEYSALLAKSIHPDDAAKLDQTFKAAREKRAIYELEHRIVRPDGSVRWVYELAYPYFDQAGNLLRYVGVTLDITERKRSEEALRNSEERVRRKLDSILTPEADLGNLELADILDIPTVQSLLDDFYKIVPVTTGLVDIQGKVLAVPGWERICKQFHRSHPETCKNCTESDVLLSAGVAPGEFKIYRCKNNMIDVATPIMIGGQHLGNLYLGQFLFKEEPIDYEVFRAQARQYSFEEKDYLAALDAVPRLTREAVHACIGFLSKLSKVISQLSYSSVKLARSSTQLGRVNVELTASNKDLEAFTYSVSHDLRAPLRHIGGFSKILSEEFASQLPAEAQHHLKRIEDGTRRMGTLVDDLLNLAHVGRRDITLQVTGLKSVVQEVIAGLAPDIGSRQVEWKIGELPYVECDTALMKQVFQNLLANAVKFTRPRKRAIIEIGREDKDGASVIYVRDNGVGFSMKYADKLFGVFQRLHRSEDFEGTGVGLATVQRIIQKHGGRIWAEAELDKGATFYFALGNTETGEPKSTVAAAGVTT